MSRFYERWDSRARAVEHKCAIRSLLDQYNADAYMHSRDPEKVRSCGTEKNIIAVYIGGCR